MREAGLEPEHDAVPHAHVHISETGRHAHPHTGPGHMGIEHSHMHDHVTAGDPAPPRRARPAVNYILVEVRERDPGSPARDAGYLRGRLHDTVASLGLDAADILVRSDRDGGWEKARDLYAAEMASWRARRPWAGPPPLDLCPPERLGRRSELRREQEHPGSHDQ